MDRLTKVFALFGVSSFCGLIAAWSWSRIQASEKKRKRYDRERVWEVEDLVNHVKQNSSSASLMDEYNEFSKMYLVKGRLWSDKPLKVTTLKNPQDLIFVVAFASLDV